MQLPIRLLEIAQKVPVGFSVADVGTDHAYIPTYLIKKGLSPKVIATDVNKGPFNIAKERVRALKLENKIDVRMGNGLEPIKPQEVELAIIAGMGGLTIVDILTNSPRVVNSLKMLILQPMMAEDVVRRWLQKNNWDIFNEAIVKEDNKYYQIISAVPNEISDKKADAYPWPGENQLLYWELGPLLIREGNMFVVEQIDAKLNNYQQIEKKLAITSSEKGRSKLEEIRSILTELEELKRECLLNANK